MPIYEYVCPCGRTIERFEPMSGEHQERKCECGKTASRIYNPPCLITDTSFCMTGKRDKRLDNEVIEGRKHWDKKIEEKGYMEIGVNDYE